jgi:hypothetical protein
LPTRNPLLFGDESSAKIPKFEIVLVVVLVLGALESDPDQSVDQSAHLLDQVQICRKIPLRKVAESDRTQSDCETIGILEDEDDDEQAFSMYEIAK